MPDQLFPHLLMVGPVAHKMHGCEYLVVARRTAPRLHIALGVHIFCGTFVFGHVGVGASSVVVGIAVVNTENIFTTSSSLGAKKYTPVLAFVVKSIPPLRVFTKNAIKTIFLSLCK
jgi:hypothetical protein